VRSHWQISDDVSSEGAVMKPGRPIKTSVPIPHKDSRLTPIKCIGVISKTPSGGGYQLWKCKCSCGEFHIAIRSRIESGITKSCGCLRREMAKVRIETARAAHVAAAKKRRLANAQ
jgi:hypothetical protein